MRRTAEKDTFESWLVGETLLVALLGSATALFLTNPSLRSTYELPEGRLVLDTAVVLAATIVAILAGVRFRVEGRGSTCCSPPGSAWRGRNARLRDPARAGRRAAGRARGVGVARRPRAGGEPDRARAGDPRRPDRDARPRALDRRGPRRRSASSRLDAAAVAGDALESLDPGLGGSRPVELTVTLSALALLALLTVIGFALRYRSHGEDLDSWLALGATLTLFAELHYVLTDHYSTDFVSQGDFLRLLAYGLLLVGVWRAISFAEFGRAVAEERARVASEIHDGLAQYLFAMSTHASMLESGASVEQTLPKLKEAAAAAQQEARFAVLALSSASGNAPFDAALRRYVEFLTADGALAVDVEVDEATLLAPDEQIEVFRIVQEGLANVRKHASARRAEVWIGQRQGRRIVRIRDDGTGFDGEEAAAGQGLKNMRRRAASIDGAFSLSSRPGRGTALEVLLRA